MKKYIFLSLLFTPFLSHAANILNLVQNLIIVLNSVVIPFLFGIAFLMFVINAFRYFILEGSSEEGREKAKSLALYSVAALVFVSIFWGLVQLLVGSIGLTSTQPCPDYIKKYDPAACPP